MSRYVSGITCMMPIAPAFDVIGFLSSSSVRPPLSMRMTALIQVSATPKRREASWIRGVQRSISCAGLSACSFTNADPALEVIVAMGFAKAPLEDANKLPRTTGKNSNFLIPRDADVTIDHPVHHSR